VIYLQTPGGQMGLLAAARVGTVVAVISISSAARQSSDFFMAKLLVEVGVTP
jgi:hypothetical protein